MSVDVNLMKTISVKGKSTDIPMMYIYVQHHHKYQSHMRSADIKLPSVEGK